MMIDLEKKLLHVQLGPHLDENLLFDLNEELLRYANKTKGQETNKNKHDIHTLIQYKRNRDKGFQRDNAMRGDTTTRALDTNTIQTIHTSSRGSGFDITRAKTITDLLSEGDSEESEVEMTSVGMSVGHSEGEESTAFKIVRGGELS